MQRFFFHMRNHSLRLDDAEGMLLPSTAAAYAEAVASGRCMMSHDLAKAEIWEGWYFEIANESGDVIDTIPFDFGSSLH